MTGVIDRRLEVFIGATRRDLGKARNKVQEAVLEAGHFPCGMELWHSDTVPTRETIRRHLEQCDVHILIVGARYGEYIDPADTNPVSFTEWEFQEAKELKKPIIVFLLDESCYPAARRKQIEADPTEKTRETALVRFRKELRSFQFSRTFSEGGKGIEKLGRLCTNSLNELANSGRLREDAGWIRINSEDAQRTRDIRQNQFLSRVIERLRQFRTLTSRVLEQQAEKEEAAKYFWEIMAGPIQQAGYWKLFFESGSSIAYASQEFEDRVLFNDDAGPWEVRTNNVETLLQLLLHKDVNIQRLPSAAPDPKDKYGAIFPPDFRQLEQPPPKHPRRLYSRADCDPLMRTTELDAVAALQTELKKLGKALILAAASGLDLTHPTPHFRGPHVGSHSNMLFKRAIMTSGFPVVLFLDSKKFGAKFDTGKCYPVFGPDYSWNDAREKLPLAICAAWTPAAPDANGDHQVAERIDTDVIALRELGFDPDYASTEPGTDRRVVIAANKLFKKKFPAT